MKLLYSVRIGTLVLIFLNLLMAFGSIWVFLRMAPAIDSIIKKNTNTLVLCEKMLSSIAQSSEIEGNNAEFENTFSEALELARRNITEAGEPEAIAAISDNYKKAFAGEREAISLTISAIIELSSLNKKAMVLEDKKARKLGSGGAWGVVFMATIVFTVTLLLVRGLRRTTVSPLEEINAVVQANLRGDTMRRCFGTGIPKDVKVLYDGINDILDGSSKRKIMK